MLDRLWQLITWQLPPHGYCLLWDPILVGAHVISDALIAIAYFAIPIALIRLMRARRDVPFGWIFLLFATFILACGTTHILMIWNLWHGDYGVEALVKVVTAAASVATNFVLWQISPQLIALPSSQHLQELNLQLQQTVEELKTEKREKERAQASLIQSQKMEAVGQLTGGIAHDFNNLLMGIRGSMELIKKNPQNTKVDKWANAGIEAVERAAHLTAQLLTFSRVQKLQLKEITINPLLTNLLSMIVRTIGTDIRVTLKTDNDVSIMADAVQLELAIINLALNARDAMPGGGNLVISTSVIEGFLEIDVTDTGTGISDANAPRVFEPFFTTKDIGKGTGLGLSMVYGVAVQLGGDVYIKKTSPKGTTFTITIPLLETIPEKTTDEETVTTVVVSNNKHILLIDDDTLVRETLGEMLESMGYDVHLAEDGVEALVYLKLNKPDLMLIDYAMPVMNGGAVAKAARLIYQDVPIAFVTGFSASAEIEGYTVLKKPFSMKDVEELLGCIFGNN